MYILKDRVQAKKGSAYVYFREMTDIGPRLTDDIELAEVFDSKTEAMGSPAYMHPLCFFEPEKLEPTP